MVYNLKDFETFTPTKKTLAVMGNPIAHSLSPVLHLELAKKAGLDFDYIALQVSPEEFPRVLELAREKLWGFNLTMPLKQQVIPYLDYADDEVSLTGSANTIVVKDGKLYGYTTDGVGLCDALLMEFDTLNEKEVLILGAGGAARSVASALIRRNAKVTVAVRSKEKGERFTKDIACDFVLMNDISDKFDIFINATPLGMNSDDPAPVDISTLEKLSFVYDCIYNPPMTKLLINAKEQGIGYDNGLSMLVLQGAYAERHWFDATFDKDIIKGIIKKLRAQNAILRLKDVYNKSNIVLTGFMGSGKTTVGKWLAEVLGVEFVDLDSKIETEQNMKITEIFDKYGEEYFRKLETKACEDCLRFENTVISTGGGTVIRFDNDKILKKNSLIIFLNRTLDEIYRNLQGSTNRPLLQVQNVEEHIRSLYEMRQPQYLERADIAVTFPGGADPVNEILLFI